MFIAGQTPTILRQECPNQYMGVAPVNAVNVLFEPRSADGLMLYVNPEDHTEHALNAGGLFDFSTEQTVRILEIRGLTALGNLTPVVQDRRDWKTMILTVGGATPAIDLGALGVIAGDRITVTSPGPLVENYTVEQVIDAVTALVSTPIADRSLAAGDVFEITSRDGSVVKYTHTLAGVDTLDVNRSTVHDSAVATPAASRIVFDAPLIVTPGQLLSIGSAAADADGWIDVYVVKAHFL